jgi:hypothetical protein
MSPLLAIFDHADIQPEGDSGGELDPHGPDAVGNPIGGNVTSDVSGEDVFYEEVRHSFYTLISY